MVITFKFAVYSNGPEKKMLLALKMDFGKEVQLLTAQLDRVVDNDRATMAIHWSVESTVATLIAIRTV